MDLPSSRRLWSFARIGGSGRAAMSPEGEPSDKRVRSRFDKEREARDAAERQREAFPAESKSRPTEEELARLPDTDDGESRS
jgi:hypothetical protein